MLSNNFVISPEWSLILYYFDWTTHVFDSRIKWKFYFSALLLKD